HAFRRVTPRAQVDFAEAIATDVGLGVDELAEDARIELVANPAEVALAAALIAERKHNVRGPAGRDAGARVSDRVRNRLVEKHVLSGKRGGARSLEMRVVGRRVDDRIDAVVR